MEQVTNAICIILAPDIEDFAFYAKELVAVYYAFCRIIYVLVTIKWSRKSDITT